MGEGGGKGEVAGVTPLLGLPLRGGAVAPCGPCQDGSWVTDGEVERAAGTAASLRGLPLGLAALTAAAVAAASAAASAGVLQPHPGIERCSCMQHAPAYKREQAQPMQAVSRIY